MKIVIGSDFHSEFKEQKELPPLPECDLLVLAGDIDNGMEGVKWAEENAKGPCVFVPGNHEYYGHFKFNLNEEYKEHEHENVKILNPGILDMGEYVIIGATLCSALRLPGYKHYAPAAYQDRIGDFIVTKFWTPDQHIMQNTHEVQVIEAALEKYKDRKCIVVTHFVPTMQCIDPYWAGNALNPYFINNLDYLIDDHRPLAWIFGHTHTKFDKLHSNGETRLICNPRGYPKERPRPFNWKVVEL